MYIINYIVREKLEGHILLALRILTCKTSWRVLKQLTFISFYFNNSLGIPTRTNLKVTSDKNV